MPCQAATNMSAQLGVCKNVKSKCEKTTTTSPLSS